MTVHVELFLACDLKTDAPEQVIDTLKYLFREEDYEFNNPPSHPFFQPDPEEHSTYQGWRHVFKDWYADGSLDFDRFPGTGFYIFHVCSWSTTITKPYYKLTIRHHVGSHHEFAGGYFPFLQWLAPYVDTEQPGTFVGCIRRTNWGTTNPALIYFDEGKVYFSEIEEALVEIDDETVWNFV